MSLLYVRTCTCICAKCCDLLCECAFQQSPVKGPFSVTACDTDCTYMYMCKSVVTRYMNESLVVISQRSVFSCGILVPLLVQWVCAVKWYSPLSVSYYIVRVFYYTDGHCSTSLQYMYSTAIRTRILHENQGTKATRG